MKSLLLSVLFLALMTTQVESSRSILFTDPVENEKMYNWLALGYGVPHAIMSEVGYFYHKDCFTGMLTFGNGVIGMQVFSDFAFITWVDWAKYFLALAQLVSDSFIALVYCGYTVRLQPSPADPAPLSVSA